MLACLLVFQGAVLRVTICVLLQGALFQMQVACQHLTGTVLLLPLLQTHHECPAYMVQTVDKQQELARVHKLASFNSINIQASSAGGAATHVLAEDETPVATPTALADVTAALKGGDGYDRLLEFRCGRYLYHHGQATFLPVPAMPDDFAASLRGVAGSRNIKGGCRPAWRGWEPSSALDAWLLTVHTCTCSTAHVECCARRTTPSCLARMLATQHQASPVPALSTSAAPGSCPPPPPQAS